MKKNKIFLALCIGFVAAMGFTPLNAFAAGGTLSGTGTETDPYLIEDRADLFAFADIVNGTNGATLNTAACGRVTQNIGVAYSSANDNWKLDNAFAWTPMGIETAPYTGTFVADSGVVIYGMTIGSDYTYTGNNKGLFGYIREAEIKNVSLGDIKIMGDTNIGGIVGYAVDSKISGCTIESNDTGFQIHGLETVGGIAGYTQDTYITDCKNQASIRLIVEDDVSAAARHKLGGIAGMVKLTDRTGLTADKVLVKNCENTGNIRCRSVNDAECTGGIVGRVVSDSSTYRVIIKDCTNKGNVRSIEAGTGGIAGYTYNALIKSCENYGEINSSNTGTGGIVGIAKCCELNACHNYGTIRGIAGVGGIAGYANYGTDIIDCHNEGSVTGMEYTTGSGETAQTIQPCYVGGIAGSVLSPRGMTYRDEGSGETAFAIPQNKMEKNTTISGCTNSGTVTCEGDYSEPDSLIISHPSTNEPIAMAVGGSYAGGIIGASTDSVYFSEEGNKIYIEGCANSGSVNGAKTGYTKGAVFTGGILGSAKNTIVTNCNNNGTVADAGLSDTDTIQNDIGGYVFTVCLNGNGGTVSPGLVLAKNGKIETLPTPSKAGCVFEGWYNGNTLYQAGMDVSDKITLQAKWKADNQSGTQNSLEPGGTFEDTKNSSGTVETFKNQTTVTEDKEEKEETTHTDTNSEKQDDFSQNDENLSQKEDNTAENEMGEEGDKNADDGTKTKKGRIIALVIGTIAVLGVFIGGFVIFLQKIKKHMLK